MKFDRFFFQRENQVHENTISALLVVHVHGDAEVKADDTPTGRRILGIQIGGRPRVLKWMFPKIMVPWNYPPPSKSHHQDYSIFSRESL